MSGPGQCHANQAQKHSRASAARTESGRRTVTALASRPAQVAWIALLLGLLVYLLARQPGTVYLLPAWPDLTGAVPSAFAAIGNQLPSFLHTLAFSLLTYLCLAPSRRAALISAGAWLLINTLFEIGQAPAAARWIAAHTPGWFASVPLLDNIPDYFLAGTFDYLDLVAIVAGAVSA